MAFPIRSLSEYTVLSVQVLCRVLLIVSWKSFFLFFKEVFTLGAYPFQNNKYQKWQIEKRWMGQKAEAAAH